VDTYSNARRQGFTYYDRSRPIGGRVPGPLVPLQDALRSRAFLLGEGVHNRKEWLGNRLQ
jgi:hypothetical protein